MLKEKSPEPWLKTEQNKNPYGEWAEGDDQSTEGGLAYFQEMYHPREHNIDVPYNQTEAQSNTLDVSTKLSILQLM